ncbi:HBL308Wp [Eremothecium sinecaudum]|uniref:HBL308Wp n=1 Tax=Eremothecium sinecaudum TaxID=45286 RepID=A0A109UW40_9SACH|nr:HBL308Wp [Eremothecium sinecaudum]AMD18594.1 HBL308Wp [Eremothecium sinecaudum]
MLERIGKMVFGGAAVAVSACLGALYVYQNKLVYPSWAQGARMHVDTPDMYGLPYKELRLITNDGVEIRAFDIRNQNSKAVFLVLAPNAGNIGYFLSIAELLYKQFGLSVLLYSYRGYGFSGGEPSEQGLKLDADCVMEYISRERFFSSRKVILYGRSLGGANAIYIARKYGRLCDAMVLENTFLSIPKVIPYIFPLLKYVACMCHEIWNSEAEMPLVDSSLPVLFLSGQNDEIVPPAHMKTLFDLCPSTSKQFFTFPLGYHNDTIVQPGYWDIVHDFLQKNKVL